MNRRSLESTGRRRRVPPERQVRRVDVPQAHQVRRNSAGLLRVGGGRGEAQLLVKAVAEGPHRGGPLGREPVPARHPLQLHDLGVRADQVPMGPGRVV